jgi:AraC-like DNA-binding protein
LSEDALMQTDARMPVHAFVALVERARAMSGDPAIGVRLGMQMRASAYGYLGFAAMTAASLREAIELAIRFAPTRSDATSLRLREEGTAVALVVEEHADFGTARDVVLIALMVGLWQIGNAITGRTLDGRADFAFPEPEYWTRAAPSGAAVRFAQPVNQLVFDAAQLDLPLKGADRASASLRLAREQCERGLDALGAEAHIVARVRSLIARPGGGARSLEEVAARMHLSARTLKRKLGEHGVTYSSLVESDRRERALLLLRSTDLSLGELADRVGYSDVANFTRAFRRWTGRTPARYRREVRARPD